jgi:hypothetical protein
VLVGLDTLTSGQGDPANLSATPDVTFLEAGPLA